MVMYLQYNRIMAIHGAERKINDYLGSAAASRL
jgi:hypothetical protein